MMRIKIYPLSNLQICNTVLLTRVAMLYIIPLWKVKALIVQLCWFFSTPRTVAHLGFSRQEYWSGLPFPSPGDLLDPVIKPGNPTLQADTVWATREAPYPHDIYFITGSLYLLTPFACIFHLPTPCSADMGVVFVFVLDFTYKWDHMMFVFLTYFP